MGERYIHCILNVVDVGCETKQTVSIRVLVFLVCVVWSRVGRGGDGCQGAKNLGRSPRLLDGSWILGLGCGLASPNVFNMY